MNSVNKINSISGNKNFQSSFLFQEFAFAPLNFVDIGARGGAHKLIDPIARLTRIFAFEPDEEEFNRLKHTEIANEYHEIEVLQTALADVKGLLPFYVTRNPNNTSLLKVSDQFLQRYGNKNWETVRSGSVTVTTLDDVFAPKDTKPDVIKVDVQGAELKTLAGAESILKDSVVAVLAEVSFIESYESQPLFSEVELFLRQRGFAFVGFVELNHRSTKTLDKLTQIGRERMFWGDALFIKDFAAKHVAQIDKRQLAVAITVCLLTEFFDLSLELGRIHENEAESECIGRLVREVSTIDHKQMIEDIKMLSQQTERNPRDLMHSLGKLIDRYRLYHDFKDLP